MKNKFSEKQILEFVYKLANENPTLCARMVDSINRGLNDAFIEMRRQCSTMEFALAQSITNNKGRNHEFIKEKLILYEG